MKQIKYTIASYPESTSGKKKRAIWSALGEFPKLFGHACDIETLVSWIIGDKNFVAFNAFSPAFVDRCAVKGP